LGADQKEIWVEAVPVLLLFPCEPPHAKRVLVAQRMSVKNTKIGFNLIVVSPLLYMLNTMDMCDDVMMDFMGARSRIIQGQPDHSHMNGVL
jgi:hypothetical protein